MIYHPRSFHIITFQKKYCFVHLGECAKGESIMCSGIKSLISYFKNYKTNETVQKEMLMQLHEQYAINNNANLGSMVTLLAALIAIIGGYGYVFLHLDIANTSNVQFLCLHPDFSFVSLILIATATMVVLVILKYICMYQGFAQRKEQFIIYAIRYKYELSISKANANERIFPINMPPFIKRVLLYIKDYLVNLLNWMLEKILSIIKFMY